MAIPTYHDRTDAQYAAGGRDPHLLQNASSKAEDWRQEFDEWASILKDEDGFQLPNKLEATALATGFRAVESMDSPIESFGNCLSVLEEQVEKTRAAFGNLEDEDYLNSLPELEEALEDAEKEYPEALQEYDTLAAKKNSENKQEH